MDTAIYDEQQKLKNNEDNENLNESLGNNEICKYNNEEIEPKFIFERMDNDCKKIFENDSISCSVVYAKFIIFGTSKGYIHILDHLGNSVQKPIKLHDYTIRDVSIEEKGEYLVSCSLEKVVIFGIYNSDDILVLKEENVKSVAIDPYYLKATNKQRIITASNKIILHEKNFLLKYKSKILYYDDEQIINIKWKDNLVVWSNTIVVRIFDIEERMSIAYIKREFNIQKPILSIGCNFYWIDENNLLIGWGNTIKLCRIKERNLNETLTEKKLPKKFVFIPSLFSINQCVCGIAPFKQNFLIISTPFDLNVNTKENDHKLGIKVIEPLVEDYNEVSENLIPIKNFENWNSKDYKLEYLQEDSLYFIITPKDVIVAKPIEEDDHIEWLLNKNKFDEALKDIKSCLNLKKYSYLSVGKLYLKHLIEENTDESYKKAAEICANFLCSDTQCWEELILQFLKKKKLHLLEPYIPVKKKSKFSHEIGEIILNYFLELDPLRFLNIIRKWPSDMYNVSELIKTVELALSMNSDNKYLYEALAELYIHQGEYDKALVNYISINNKEEIFNLIKTYNLISSLNDKMEILMKLNPNETSNLLIENIITITVEYVVERLKNQKKLLLPYLHKLVQKDPDLCIDYHEDLIELYANYSPENLLDFLKSSNNYLLEKALKICTDLKLIPEVVFLLSKMGDDKKALKYIIQSMNDIYYAVEFCQQHSDNELWEELISHALKDPQHIKILIQNIGAHIPDPISFINRIPKETKIQGLMSALEKILNDYNLQISLEKCCKRILMSDCYDLMYKLNTMQKKGNRVSESAICKACDKKIIYNEIRNCFDVVIFNCKHIFHEKCLPVTKDGYFCTFCSDFLNNS